MMPRMQNRSQISVNFKNDSNKGSMVMKQPCEASWKYTQTKTVQTREFPNNAT
jgi:hypothetical protein